MLEVIWNIITVNEELFKNRLCIPIKNKIGGEWRISKILV